MIPDYDAEAGALYIIVAVGDHGATVPIAPSVMVDVSTSDTLLGIEVLAPDTAWDPEPIIDRWGLDPSDARALRRLSAWSPGRPVGHGGAAGDGIAPRVASAA